MPALRFRFNSVSQVISPTCRDQHTWVGVRLKNGKEQRMECLGFICQYATELMPEGCLAKVVAASVTPDSDEHTHNWTELNHDQVVVGWRVLWSDKGISKWGGVYRGQRGRVPNGDL